MLFDVAVRYSGGVAILKTPGSLTLSSGCEIRPAAVAVCESGHHLILIDCLDTVRADSSGLGEMVAAYSAVIGRGGALKLLNVSDRLAKLLNLTGLDRLFEVHSDERTAIASFRNAPNAKARAALDGFLDT